MDVSGRVALVTGGAAGLGRAVALALAERGATVALTYLSAEDDARATIEAAGANGPRLHPFRSDVADWAVTDALVAEIERTLGPIAILVNNAGTTAYARDPLEMSHERWDRVMAVNLGGSFGCIRAVVPHMMERGAGTIVNIGSVAGVTGVGSSIAYTVSKAAVITMTQFLARDLAPNVRINAVAPGSMPTNWHGRYYPGMTATAHEMTPIERVADAVLWLITNDSVTGQAIVVDGGEHLSPSEIGSDG